MATAGLPALAAVPEDDMADFMTDKGLVNRMEHPGHPARGDRPSDVVATAQGFLGVPYRRGGNSGETGFDCSGFVKAIYAQTLGLVLPRRADEQAAATQVIDRRDLQPGDLVFFNTLRRAFSHVGIYVGDNKFIHSPRSGARVRVEDMGMSYWQSRFDGARRVAMTPTASPLRARRAKPARTAAAAAPGLPPGVTMNP